MTIKPTPRVTVAWHQFRQALALSRLDDYMLTALHVRTRDQSAVPQDLIDAIYRIAENSQTLALTAEEYAKALTEQESK